MTYSKIHQAFSKHLKNPDVLKNPAKYLGPNYQDVLNFWIYVDSLNDEEKSEMWRRYWSLNCDVRVFAIDTARDAADEVVGCGFRLAVFSAARDVIGWRVFGWATYELIGSHKLLEQYKTPTVLPLCVKP
jgi:hypothetical protein